MPLDLLLPIRDMGRGRPPLESPLNFAHEPEVAQDGQQTGLGTINTPFQTLKRRLHGFVEIIRIRSLDRGIQRHAYVEAVPGKLHTILVINHLVLVGHR